jgi:hypothetical protein
MKRNPFGIAEGGEQRLRETIEAQVRQEHEAELSAATDDWQRAAIEEKIQRKIKDQMKRVLRPILFGVRNAYDTEQSRMDRTPR